MSNINVYQIVTDKIIAGLKQGNIPWDKPWKGGGSAKNFISKKPYTGINAFLLSIDLAENGYKQPYYLTFKQAKEKGGTVKEGSKSQLIVYWNWIIKNTGEFDKDGKALTRKFPILKYYRVFNIEQVNGLKYDAIVEDKPIDPIAECEKILENCTVKPEIRNNELRAYYSPAKDYINVPKKEFFKTSEGFYCTLFHELVHSTGHASRLNRTGVAEFDTFGSHKYSQEELIAEIGSVFLCTISGIDKQVEDNSQAYINSWIKALENDPKMIIYASAKAQKAVDYIQGINQTVKAETEPVAITV